MRERRGDDFAPVRTDDQKITLRLVTCGSAEAGKSTLVGRLAQEATRAGRHFIAADPCDDKRYTRDIVTAALTADATLLLIDARTGLLTETKRHSQLVGLLGVRNVIVVVNKIDLVEYSEARFREIEHEYLEFAGRTALEDVTCIPVSALHGDNVLTRSARTPWHQGPALMECLDGAELDRGLQSLPFRMPVQRVDGPDGYTGTVASGTLRTGDEVVVAPSGRQTKIERIVGSGRYVEIAAAEQSVTLTVADEIDVRPGDVISEASEPPGIADQFEATIVWMDEKPMLRGRSYRMAIGGKAVTVTIAPLKHKLGIDSRERIAATKLESGEIGVCAIECSESIAFDPYRENREMGGFILMDRITNDAVGAALINFALRRSQNVRWQAVNVDKRQRATSLRQRPTVLWLTGLSGAGKSTVANLVESELHRRGHHTYMLDGDNVRHGLNADLGFSAADRVENIRRVGEVAKLMVDAGLIVLVSFISPFRAEREMARSLFDPGEFIEIYVDTPLEIAEERDTKGLYQKARRGELINFTGIDSPYEPPDDPEICVNTVKQSAPEAAEQVLQLLEDRGRLGAPKA